MPNVVSPSTSQDPGGGLGKRVGYSCATLNKLFKNINRKKLFKNINESTTILP